MAIFLGMEENLKTNIDDDSQKKTRRKKPKEGFLSKVNLEGLKKELGFSAAEDIGVFVKLANPKNVYNWDKDQENHGSRPSWNAIIRMLQNGASVETLFGIEYKRTKSPENIADAEAVSGAERAYSDMKMRGLIKDEVAKEIAAMKAKGLL